jgi:WD40 repeat protein
MNDTMKISKKADFTGHTGSVYALSPALNTSNFLSAGGDRIIAEWEPGNPENGSVVARTSDIIYSLLKLPQQELLLAGQATGGIHVVNLHSRKEERLLQYHKSPIFDLAHAPKSNLIFSLGGDGTLGVINEHDLSLKRIIQIGDGKLRVAAIHPQEQIVAIGVADGSIAIFSLPDLKLIHSWQAHQNGFSVNALTFSADGNHLLSGSRDAHLQVYDVTANYKMTQKIPAHNYAIYSIVFHPTQNIFATGSRDKTIKIWDGTTFEVIKRIDKISDKGHVNSVNKLLFLADGLLLSASDDRSVMAWEFR